MTINIESMLKPEVYDHPTKNIELIETHISWIILTGDFAYKIKKPVDFGFLNFSTLQKRKDCCEKEVQLNSRLAPALYLDVVSITRNNNKLLISDTGEAVEYAVKMLQFPQSTQLDNMLTANQLKTVHIDAIAHMIADFHKTNKVADDTMSYGNKEQVYQPVAENFAQIKEHMDTSLYAKTLSTLEQWSKSEHTKFEVTFSQRKSAGFIRECHGDMHLRNLIWYHDQAMAFDCIEFNAQLRWIDVISEVAFLMMDLQDRQQHHLANRFINCYLEITGDYAGLSILPFYLCYRAMVRAKVDTLRLQQNNILEHERNETLAEFKSYLELAMRYTQQSNPKLIITRGLSASGKSTVSQQLVDTMGLIRIRSDVERKRLFNISITTNAENDVNTGIYSTEASKQTYDKLAELASLVIGAGYSVVVDAAFLSFEQRRPFQLLASRLAVPYIVLEIKAPDSVLRERIKARKNDVSDADLAVLEHQISNWEPLQKDEINSSFIVDTTTKIEISRLVEQLKIC